MSAIIDAFIEEARAVTVTDVAAMIGIVMKAKTYAGPCPVCHGKDRFAISAIKQAWNCRNCGIGGHDGISIMAHAQGLDTRTRTGLLTACSEVLGKPVPEEGERETEEEKAARLERLDALRRKGPRALFRYGASGVGFCRARISPAAARRSQLGDAQGRRRL